MTPRPAGGKNVFVALRYPWFSRAAIWAWNENCLLECQVFTVMIGILCIYPGGGKL